MQIKTFVGFMTLLALIAACSDAWAQKKLYRWVDENGNVFYSDQVPPDEVDRARDEFSERGTRAGQVDRALTAEERAAAERAAAARAEAARSQEESERAKRNLLVTYPSEEDLLRTQRQRIEMLDSHITTSRASLASQERSLAGMLSHAADAERAGKKVPERIATQIASLRSQVEAQMAHIAEKEAEKEAALKRHELELARYREVRDEMASARR